MYKKIYKDLNFKENCDNFSGKVEFIKNDTIKVYHQKIR